MNRRGDAVLATAARHGSVSVIVLGKGAEPALESEPVAGKQQTLARLFGNPLLREDIAARPSIEGVAGLTLKIHGVQLGFPGPVEVRTDGRAAGKLSGDSFTCDLPAKGGLPIQPPQVAMVSGDDGVWYLPSRIELVAKTRDGKRFRVAEWTPRCGSDGDFARGEIRLPLGVRGRSRRRGGVPRA